MINKQNTKTVFESITAIFDKCKQATCSVNVYKGDDVFDVVRFEDWKDITKFDMLDEQLRIYRGTYGPILFLFPYDLQNVSCSNTEDTYQFALYIKRPENPEQSLSINIVFQYDPSDDEVVTMITDLSNFVDTL